MDARPTPSADAGLDWIREAEGRAAEWPTSVLQGVLAAWPYGENPRGVRRSDWVVLVAHVSHRRDELPTMTAERLALYVSSYRERYQKTLSPNQVKETQET